MKRYFWLLLPFIPCVGLCGTELKFKEKKEISKQELVEIKKALALNSQNSLDNSQRIQNLDDDQKGYIQELEDDIRGLQKEVLKLKKKKRGFFSRLFSGASSHFTEKVDLLKEKISEHNFIFGQEKDKGEVDERGFYRKWADRTNCLTGENSSRITSFFLIMAAGSVYLLFPPTLLVGGVGIFAISVLGGAAVLEKKVPIISTAIAATITGLYTTAEAAVGVGVDAVKKVAEVFEDVHDTATSFAFVAAGAMAATAVAAVGTPAALGAALALPVAALGLGWGLMKVLGYFGVPKWWMPFGPLGPILPILKYFGIPVPAWLLAMSFGIPLRAMISIFIVVCVCLAIKGYFEHLKKSKEPNWFFASKKQKTRKKKAKKYKGVLKKYFVGGSIFIVLIILYNFVKNNRKEDIGEFSPVTIPKDQSRPESIIEEKTKSPETVPLKGLKGYKGANASPAPQKGPSLLDLPNEKEDDVVEVKVENKQISSKKALLDFDIEDKANRWREDNIDVTNKRFLRSNFSSMDFKGLCFKGTEFRSCNMKGSDFTNVDFTDADLTGADFTRAILNNTDFTRARTVGVIFPKGFKKVIKKGTYKKHITDTEKDYYRIMGKKKKKKKPN